MRKISPAPGFEPWTLQPVASRYTDCAIPAHKMFLGISKKVYSKYFSLIASVPCFVGAGLKDSLTFIWNTNISRTQTRIGTCQGPLAMVGGKVMVCLAKWFFSAAPCGDKEEIQRDMGIFNGISVRVGTTKLSLAAGWATTRAVSRVITLPVGFPCTPPTVFSVSWPRILYSCPILMKLEFSGQIFENYSNIKFHENPSSGSRVVPCGRTDGQT
jgi:hypothetical protein